ncbi:hypothetical protein mRhiFer1_008489 [Rhinolophus ferrumequinum]|uniref:Uncharacterized protein n=1 Tax=Rhinolophus ferrumequinum TaxID=59479 RepID=A0A7J7UWX8_RHIFE|nr:hypothetical protein mRhiFer1_008489 [Rhinolophus ferrumequinum]
MCLYPPEVVMRPGSGWVGSQAATVCYFGHHGQWRLPRTSRSLALFLEKDSKERDCEVGPFFHLFVHEAPLFLIPPHPQTAHTLAALVSGFLNATITLLRWLFLTGSMGKEVLVFWPGENRP